MKRSATLASSKTTPLMTRRTAVAASFALLCGKKAGVAQAQASPIVPIDLGHGLEILDYRIFPTEDVRRFIVEIHNGSTEPVDTPTVGVVFPHMREGHNFAWANFVSPVLYPGTSDVLIGVAPDELTSDDEWGEPEWVLCGEIETKHSRLADGWDFLIQSGAEVRAADYAVWWVTLYNRTDTRSGSFRVTSTVRDQDGRLCGALLPMDVHNATPGEPVYLHVEVRPRQQYIANPFLLVSSVEEMTFSSTIQPRIDFVNQSCTRVFPWNSE